MQVGRTLPARGSARVEVGALLADRGLDIRAARGGVAVMVQADGPLVAEVDPAPSPATPVKQTGCTGIQGRLTSCARHYLPPQTR